MNLIFTRKLRPAFLQRTALNVTRTHGIAGRTRLGCVGSAVTIPRRAFFSLGNERKEELNRARQRLQHSNDDQSKYDYVRLLGKFSPRDALAAIEKGWATDELPMTEPFIREYLKAAAGLNKLDNIDLASLMNVINRPQGNTACAFGV